MQNLLDDLISVLKKANRLIADGELLKNNFKN
jgi:hypothetical protein